MSLPPVVFGKIPDRADFVRLGSSPALDALDTVTQRALWPSPGVRRGPLYRFVYHPPGGPEALVGALQLSADRVGREYPLVVARPVDRRALSPADVPSGPLRWTPVVDAAAAAVRRGVDEAAPAAEVAERARALPPAPWEPGRPAAVEAHVRAAAALPARDFFAGLPGGPDLARLALHRLAAALRRAEAPGYGLSAPLPAPTDAFGRAAFGRADGVAFWLAAGAHLLRSRPLWPSLFWRDAADGRPGALVVFYARLSSPAFRALLVGADDPATVLDLGAPPDADARRVLDDRGSALARLLDDPRASVADVLARLPTLV